MTPSQEDFLLDDPAQEDRPDFGQVLLFGIGRFRYWVVLFVMLGGLGGLAVGLMQPNQFTSEVKVLVRPGYRMLRSPTSMVDPGGGQLTGMGSVVADEIQILTNRDLAERVADKLGAPFVLQPYDPGSRDSDETSWLMRKLHEVQASWASRSSSGIPGDLPHNHPAAARLISRNLSVSSERGTSVIVLSYTAHSPKIARSVADAFLEVALEYHGEVFSSEADFAKVRQDHEQAQERAEQAIKDFRDHREVCGVDDFDAQRAELVRVIQQRQNLIDQARDQLEGINNGLTFLDEKLASISSGVDIDVESLAAVGRRPNPEYARLQLILHGLQDQRRGLKRDFKTDSERYITEKKDLTAQIEETEESLAIIQQWLPEDAGGGRTANPTYVKTMDAKFDLEQQQMRLIGDLDSQEQTLKVYEAKLKTVLVCEPVHKNYRDAISRAEKEVADLETIVTLQKALAKIDPRASLMVIQPPTLPTEKDGPKRIQILVLGIALGLFVGVTFATLRQVADSKMRYPAEVETLLGIPVLGLIPECRGWRRLGHQLGRHTEDSSPKPA